jgi:hypothetical protein
MTRLLAASSPTTDPLDAMLPHSTATSPLRDFADALHGPLGVTLAVLAAAVLAWSIHRVLAARRRRAWSRSRLVSSTASRGFALYRCAAVAPGADVRALTPSWPEDGGLSDQPTPFAPPSAGDVQPPPWATWVRR